MRFVLTAVVLTMLAQPVWANPLIAKKHCEDLWGDLLGNLEGLKGLSETYMTTEDSEKREEIGKKRIEGMEQAANTATVIDLVCKE